MANRGRRSDDAVYYDHMGTVWRDAKFHRRWSGRWRAEVSLGKDSKGKGVRRRVSAKTKTELDEKLGELREELAIGVPSSATYTVDNAIADWLPTLADWHPKTIATLTELLAPLQASIGQVVSSATSRPTMSWTL